MIEEALLRPGRFELNLEVGLPDEESRLEIFQDHTKAMSLSKCLDDSVVLEELARLTKIYFGAEISAVVKNAVSFALERELLREVHCINGIKIYKHDFFKALEKI